MPKSPIVEWVTDPNTAFLFGAGCSRCAGKPLMADLTAHVAASLSEEERVLYDELDGLDNRPVNIEDFLTYLLQLSQIVGRKRTKAMGEWSLERIQELIRRVVCTIVSEVGSDWVASSVHSRFLQRLAAHGGRRFCDIFSLNYDVVLEASLEALTLPYSDGFRGAENAYFDPSKFDADLNGSVVFRVHKLHGSVSWVRDEKGVIRRRPAGGVPEGSKLVIYPSEQKYYETRYGVYEILLSRFRQRLKDLSPNNKLVILGYSLSDDHILGAIVDAVQTPGSNLSVYALIGPEADVDSQVARFREVERMCDHRFSAMIGNCQFIGPALERSEWEAIKDRDLWKFENLVNYIAGGTE